MSDTSHRSRMKRPPESVQTGPAGLAPAKAPTPARLAGLWQAHPRLVTWLLLAIGMVAILLYAAQDVDLLAGQRLVLVLATIALAGLCTWIIGWEQ